MKTRNVFGILLPATLLFMVACNNDDKSSTSESPQLESMAPQLKEENVSYTGNGITMNGFVVYDENKKGPLPAVIVVHEWWGLNDYIRSRARQLAGLGYIAFAADMYGEGKTADNPGTADSLAKPFYQDPQMAKARFDAALAKLKTYQQADTDNIAAIGYCFGGAQVLNVAKLGEDLKGVVVFHGNLAVVPAKKELLKAAVLVCHGEADQFVPQTEVDLFKKQMDSIGAKYTLKTYPGATHAFTNPDATATGKKFNIPIAYNGAADTASWNDMKSFFGEIFQ